MNCKAYVYPKFSHIDTNFVRVGGHGLANLIFGWAHAFVFAKSNNIELIWPTWPQFKRKTLFGHFGDKRMYFGLFKRPECCIGGLQKVYLRTVAHRIPLAPYRVKDHDSWRSFLSPNDRSVVLEFGPEWTQYVQFDGLFTFRESIKNALKEMRPTAFNGEKNNSIALHVRMGDLPHDGKTVMLGRRVKSHAILPQQYYVEAIHQVWKKLGENVAVKLFSDAKNSEMPLILAVPNVQRIHRSCAFDEMIEMSRSRFLIASGSTFSKWASFLGDGTVVWPPLESAYQSKLDSSFELEFIPGLGLQTVS